MSGEVTARPKAAMRKNGGSGKGSVAALGIAGGLSVALVLTLTMNDPYWRLVKAESVPAPAYVPPTDLRAALALAATSVVGNADSGAVSQKPPLPAYAAQPPAGVADGFADATPVSLPPAPQADQPRIDPALDPTPELARELIDSLQIEAGDEVAARTAAISVLGSPLPPIGGIVRDEALEVGDGVTQVHDSVVFQIPAAPAQPHLSPTAESELALSLTLAQRIDVQRRLALAGFDPSGLDGVFGHRTRSAIGDFQAAWGFPASGYLDQAVIAELRDRTEGAYQALRRQAEREPAAAPAIAPAESKLARDDETGGCARRSDGRIVERQSLACDIAGLTETLAVSFGRNRLAQEDAALADAIPSAAGPSSQTARRADR